MQSLPLIVYIIGGNRLQSYSNDTIVSALIKDPDLKQQLDLTNYKVKWDCTDIVS